MTTIISLIFSLKSEAGHDLPYHQSVGLAAEAVKWKHQVFVPYGTRVSLPLNWLPLLRINDHSLVHGFFYKLWAKFKNLFTLFSSLQKNIKGYIKNKDEHYVLFVESFTASILFSFTCFVMLLKKNNFSVWVLYRYSPGQMRLRSRIYRLLNRVLNLKLGDSKFKILTDSDLLARSQEKFFKKRVKCMPIPHSQIKELGRFEKENQMITLWWPGAPRPAKGLDIINQLASYKGKDSVFFEIIVAKSVLISSAKNGAKIRIIQDSLSSEEYAKWMSTSDIILLPYNSDTYAEATSGIFVESVVMGKIPLVTDHTWMAWELKKYSLEELIVDWNAENFFENAKKIFENKEIRIKLQKMQKSYLLFHNEVSFGNHMKQLIESP